MEPWYGRDRTGHSADHADHGTGRRDARIDRGGGRRRRTPRPAGPGRADPARRPRRVRGRRGAARAPPGGPTRISDLLPRAQPPPSPAAPRLRIGRRRRRRLHAGLGRPRAGPGPAKPGEGGEPDPGVSDPAPSPIPHPSASLFKMRRHGPSRPAGWGLARGATPPGWGSGPAPTSPPEAARRVRRRCSAAAAGPRRRSRPPR